MDFEKQFKEEKEIVNGENIIEWNLIRFHFYFASLQGLYFNGLVNHSYNKLLQPISIGVNTYAKHCMDCMSLLRKAKDSSYVAPIQIEEFLISNYSFLKDEVGMQDNITSRQLHIENPFNPNHYSSLDQQYFGPLIHLYKEVNRQNAEYGIDALLLTNSLADMGYHKGFSDADMVMILNDGVLNSHETLRLTQKRIVKLLRYLYQFDPIQHHGFVIISALDQKFYPEAAFPLILFKNALSFKSSQSKIEFNCRNDTLEKRVGLYKSIKSLYGYVNTPNRDFRNLFLLKRYISALTLFPSIYSQFKGSYIYKKDAYGVLRELFDSNTTVFTLAEEVRSTFPYCFRINQLPFFVHPSIRNQIYGAILTKQLWFDLDQLKSHTKTFLDSFVNNYAR